MKEIKGNIWDYYNKGNWIIITTNGTRKADGSCVMGRGVALEAKEKFSMLSYFIGDHIARKGNTVGYFPSVFENNKRMNSIETRIISFPVKQAWYLKADKRLITQSCKQLLELIEGNIFRAQNPKVKKIYMVRPGCGNGGLKWEEVKPILEKYLDDRFIIVENKI